MKVDRVTITGADDNTPLSMLSDISKNFPRVEWGILLSPRHAGITRFPSETSLEVLAHLKEENPVMRLSAHLCGGYVRRLLNGNPRWYQGIPVEIFDRIQLNFHGEHHGIDTAGWRELMHIDKQIIFQVDGVNDFVESARGKGIDAVPLFDASGGAGITPSEWPEPMYCYSGYAGGLTPDNIREELVRIETVVRNRTIWVDTETGVRTKNGFILDLHDKVIPFLEVFGREREE